MFIVGNAFMHSVLERINPFPTYGAPEIEGWPLIHTFENIVAQMNEKRKHFFENLRKFSFGPSIQ